jgi:hypothetical protein
MIEIETIIQGELSGTISNQGEHAALIRFCPEIAVEENTEHWHEPTSILNPSASLNSSRKSQQKLHESPSRASESKAI